MTIHHMVEELELTTMPEGFHKVSVLMTETEYQNMRKVAAITGEGTYSAAIRKALKWPEAPYGLRATLTRMIEARKAEEVANG